MTKNLNLQDNMSLQQSTAQYTYKAKGSLIDQIMKPPRLTNYEQLKRPKTNRIDLPRNKVT